ncbi:MAG: ABC transporter substrate-binding protein [Actinobacteria bacterium]|nr:ABC transporter substrate-binding protein [Actinomycetota bacterium]
MSHVISPGRRRATVRVTTALAAVGLLAGVAACSSSSSQGSSGGSSGTTSGAANSSSATWSTQTSAAAGGGMAALIAAAKKEGHLNVITLPRDWANYGALMDGFTKKYGIAITDANPDGSSADEIAAIKSLKGQSRAPDVVDVGQAFAYSGSESKLFAPYQVTTWGDIPAAAKDSAGDWYNDYGGIVSIGCDASKVNPCPTTLASLDSPAYKGKLALNGDPTQANAAINAVASVAIAKGGSLDDVTPGIKFFAQLKKDGIYEPVQATAATIESGETPIVIDWDYLNAAKTSDVDGKGGKWTVTIPTDGGYLSGYYAQAISASAPHPAAARLWEEYLYSVEGQNGFLAGGARPVEQAAMTTAGTIDKTLLAKLPAVTGTPSLPTEAQATKIGATLVQDWPSMVGGS